MVAPPASRLTFDRLAVDAKYRGGDSDIPIDMFVLDGTEEVGIEQREVDCRVDNGTNSDG
jgi:hypothetical protein